MAPTNLSNTVVLRGFVWPQVFSRSCCHVAVIVPYLFHAVRCVCLDIRPQIVAFLSHWVDGHRIRARCPSSVPERSSIVTLWPNQYGIVDELNVMSPQTPLQALKISEDILDSQSSVVWNPVTMKNLTYFSDGFFCALWVNCLPANVVW